MNTWVGHWNPFSFLPFLALEVAAIVLNPMFTNIQNPTNPFRRGPVADPDTQSYVYPCRKIS